MHQKREVVMTFMAGRAAATAEYLCKLACMQHESTRCLIPQHHTLTAARRHIIHPHMLCLQRSKAVNGAACVVGVMGAGHLRGVVYALATDNGGDTLRFEGESGRGEGPPVLLAL
jgi:hypothetical protein